MAEAISFETKAGPMYVLPKPPRGVSDEFMAGFERAIRATVEFADSGRHVFSSNPKEGSEFLQRCIRATAGLFQKWNMEILGMLGFMGTLRFSQMRKLLGSVSAKMLSEKLLELGEKGLIARRVADGRPPGVQYSLTPEGATLSRLSVPLVVYASMRLGIKPEGPIKRLGERGGLRRRIARRHR